MSRRCKSSAAYLLVAATMGCSGSDPADPGSDDMPDPGFVSVSLVVPNVNDRAIMFRLTGGAIDSLTSQGAAFFTAAETGTNMYRVVLTGSLVNGVVARFWMPDRRQIGSYTGVVEQAAASTYEQQDVSAYGMSIVR